MVPLPAGGTPRRRLSFLRETSPGLSFSPMSLLLVSFSFWTRKRASTSLTNSLSHGAMQLAVGPACGAVWSTTLEGLELLQGDLPC